MTLHWYERAKQGDRPGLNDGSGAHATPLIQYAAKWASSDTLKEMLTTEHEIEGNVERIDPFVTNDSGWSPLHAMACTPNRAAAVKLMAHAYEANPDYLFLRTTKPYTVRYRSAKGQTVEVTYPADSTAIGLIECRLQQDTGLTHREKETLRQAKNCIGESQHRTCPAAVGNEIF